MRAWQVDKEIERKLQKGVCYERKTGPLMICVCQSEVRCTQRGDRAYSYDDEADENERDHTILYHCRMKAEKAKNENRLL